LRRYHEAVLQWKNEHIRLSRQWERQTSVQLSLILAILAGAGF
jgi:hypothetical protein